MRRVTNAHELCALVSLNAREEKKPTVDDCQLWLTHPANFALRDGDDLSMFEAIGEWPGPLKGHVFFKSRGKEALQTARMMLDHAFGYGATEILGETPKRFRDALMFARLLGFKVYGEDDGQTLTRLTKHN